MDRCEAIPSEFLVVPTNSERRIVSMSQRENGVIYPTGHSLSRIESTDFVVFSMV